MKKINCLLAAFLLTGLLFTSCGPHDSLETVVTESESQIVETSDQPETTDEPKTLSEPETVSESVTVSEPETVSESVTTEQQNVQPEDVSEKMVDYIQSKSEYRYYAVLDINGDSVPELLAAKELSSSLPDVKNGADTADLYVWKDQSVHYVDQIWSKYEIPMQFDSVNHQIYAEAGGLGTSGFAVYRLNADLALSVQYCFSTNTGADADGNLTWEFTIGEEEVTADEFSEYESKSTENLEYISFTEKKAAETEAEVQSETHRTSSVETEIKKIRKICNTIDSELEQMEIQDGGGGTTRYIDQDRYIRMITVDPHAYYDMDEKTQKAKASYFYDVVDGQEQACFVSVTTENGDYYRFYLSYDPDCTSNSENCIRYIDNNGVITDYPDYVDPSDICEYGRYCFFAYMEIAWAYEGDY